MKTKHTIIFGLLLFISVSLNAQDKKDAARPEPTAEEKAWMAYMTPGPMHKMLASSDGNWNEVLTFWMAPGAPPTKAEAKCTNRMILGDRYQESLNYGTIMDMPFEGRSLVGYDNIKKVFQSTWIDNMSTGVMYMEGTYDEATKTITMKGNMVDPMSGKTEKARQTIKFIDENTHVLEMYQTKDGKEFKSMEIRFTRA